MTDSAMGPSCLACGRDASSADVLIPGIPICQSCLHPVQPVKKRVLIGVPFSRKIAWKRLRYVLVTDLIGFILGVTIGWLLLTFHPPRRVPPTNLYALILFLFGILGSLLATLIAIPFLFSRIQHAGTKEWKALLIDKLGLRSLLEQTEISHHMAIFLWERAKVWSLRIPMDVGILMESAEGLVMFGIKGSRLVLPYSAMSGAGTERVRMWPPRTALRIETEPSRGGFFNGKSASVFFFAFVEEKNFKSNKEKATAAAARLDGLVTAPS